MLYPRVIEVSRAGAAVRSFPTEQRDLVALSLAIKPAPRTARSLTGHDRRRGVFQ
jgi:hypothetical protein